MTSKNNRRLNIQHRITRTTSDEMRLVEEISGVVAAGKPDRVAILCDSNVAVIERHLIESLYDNFKELNIPVIPLIETPAGESNKNLSALENILRSMSESGLTRRSMLICIGGGMLTDIGGLAAALFKRGIRHINVATTLLGAVDAAVGGKTAIDFNGLKNEIGAFHLPVATLADAGSFRHLPAREILSGFGEVVKTAFIADEDMTRKILNLNPLEADTGTLDDICRFCRDVKNDIVEEDPTEKGRRKILNFGHTAGHAIESLLIRKGAPLPHGTAVAHGILVALILSMQLENLNKEWVTIYARWLRTYFPAAYFTCADYDELWQLATHDKKNLKADSLAYTLLKSPGTPFFERPVGRKEFLKALDIYQELMGR